MKIKSILAKPYASVVAKRIQKASLQAVDHQNAIFHNLLKVGTKTLFGSDHHFKNISNYKDFTEATKIVDYEGIKDYINLIKDGKENVLWKGKPLYFCKTSGTTSGVKYIPLTKDSMPNHINTAKNALLNYMVQSGKTDFVDGKMIFLSGSPVLDRVGNIPTGRLSGIVNHFVPGYLRTNQLPTYPTNCIEDWEEKLSHIVDETINQNMTLISGIPPWMQMYFDWLQKKSGGKKIKEIFPNLQVLVHGGVNFQPYKSKLLDSVGGDIDFIETFPASEGFFAFQDKLDEEGLLLNTDSGIFFEFIKVEDLDSPNPKRLSLSDVELGQNYALIINSNAGLWGYSIGDTVKFVSLNPYKIIVSGRVKHYISAFGEHVIAEEVEHAINAASQIYSCHINEFTVAPMVQTSGELPYHEWLIAFEQLPNNINGFAEKIDEALRKKNIYYNDLITWNILQKLKITVLEPTAFQEYMKSIGKLGGQNKVPRLTNNRELADALSKYKK